MDSNEIVRGEEAQVEQRDADVIQICLSGKPNAYEELVVRYQKPVYNLAYRLLGNTEDAKDITQEAFVKAFQSLHHYNPQYAFKSWIFRITQNMSIDQLRKRTRRPQVSMDAGIMDYSEDSEGQLLQREYEDHSPNIRTTLMEQEKNQRIQYLIQSLPEPFKSVIVLRHIEGMQLDEISKVLDMPVGTVKTNLFRARNFMKEKLKEFAS